MTIEKLYWEGDELYARDNVGRRVQITEVLEVEGLPKGTPGYASGMSAHWSLELDYAITNEDDDPRTLSLQIAHPDKTVVKKTVQAMLMTFGAEWEGR